MTRINPIWNSNSKNSKDELKIGSDKSILKESLFIKLDKDKNGVISTNELSLGGYSGKDLDALSEALFFAQRNVNKWFMIDKNKDGIQSNVEDKIWDIHNTNENHKIGDLTPEQFAKKYNMEFVPEKSDTTFEQWCKSWIENENPMKGIKKIIEAKYDVVLNEEESRLLYDVMKAQANRWLFKQDALYNRLNTSAYTRLVTDDQTVSCCGGDISKPPIGEQPKLNPDGTLAKATSCSLIFRALDSDSAYNTSTELKNRLAWAAFKTVPDEVAAKMSSKEFQTYQNDWEQIRNMKAVDFRDLLKPENKALLEEFEKKSNMTVRQIVDYIDIVENATGKNFDDNNWSVDSKMFHTDIMESVNGTSGDNKLLTGKTRKDIPPERLDWLKYLEEHNLLFEQFKE